MAPFSLGAILPKVVIVKQCNICYAIYGRSVKNFGSFNSACFFLEKSHPFSMKGPYLQEMWEEIGETSIQQYWRFLVSYSKLYSIKKCLSTHLLVIFAVKSI